MKKKIFTLIISALLVLSGGLMFACGGDNKLSPTPAKELVQVVNKMGADALFSGGNANGVSSRFILTELKNTQYEYYTECLVLPMDYINTHMDDMTKLSNMKLNSRAHKAVSALGQSISVMKENFAELSNHNERLVDFSTGSAYQGMLYKYLLLCQNFIDSVYDVAFDLAEVEDFAFGSYTTKQVTAGELKWTDSRELRDYLWLSLARDYFDLLVVNCEAQLVTGAGQVATLITNAKTELDNLLSSYRYQDDFNFKELTGELKDKKYINEKVTNLFVIQSKLNVERENFNVALQNFSLYDYATTYEGNLADYAKADGHVMYYLGYLETYLNSLEQTQAYYSSILLQY